MERPPLTSRNTQPETQRVTVNAPPQTLKNQIKHNANFNSTPHLNGNNTNACNYNSNHVSSQHNVSNHTSSSKPLKPLKPLKPKTTTTKRKIRLIIPRKRKFNEIQSKKDKQAHPQIPRSVTTQNLNGNNKNASKSSISSDSKLLIQTKATNSHNSTKINGNHNHIQEPPTKKQRISPPISPQNVSPKISKAAMALRAQQMFNKNNASNDEKSDIKTSPRAKPKPKPQPKPQPIFSLKTSIDSDQDKNTNNNKEEEEEEEEEDDAPLPPPPPLQSVTPPPPPPQNPLSHLRSQLQTHFAWPTHNAHGHEYSHICRECGQGFMSGQALGGHMSQHKRARQRAISNDHYNQQHRMTRDQYYYPGNYNPNVQRIGIDDSKYFIANGIRTPHKTHDSPLANYQNVYVYQQPKQSRPRRNDPHNQMDANGNFPTHDKDGNPYTHICETCGKGFSTGSALGGHRSVHRRMEKMGKMYNKLTGKHEYIDGYQANADVNHAFNHNGNYNGNDNGKPQFTPRTLARYSDIEKDQVDSHKLAIGSKIGKAKNIAKPNRNRMRQLKSLSALPMKNEYSGLNNTEIMNKIIDKLWNMDQDKHFHQEDISKEYKEQVSETLSFKIIKDKIKENKYPSVQQDFMGDLNKLFRFAFRVYSKNDCQVTMALKLKQFAYKEVMSAVQANASKSITPNTSLSSIDIHGINESNGGELKCLQLDGYEKIDDYEFFCDDGALVNKMTCNKKVECDGKWCMDYNNLGPYRIAHGKEQWESKCQCRSQQMECTSECKCDPIKCKNRAISSRTIKELGKQVREQEVFGIDQHTRMCLEKALPTRIKEMYPDIDNAKSHFIENKLLPAINEYNFFAQQHTKYKSKYDKTIMTKVNAAEANFMMTDVLRMMLFKAETVNKDKNLCRILSFLLRLILNMGTDQLTNEISGIERSKRRMNWDDDIVSITHFINMYEKTDFDVSGEDIICHEEFPIYSKGAGVICIDKKGIKCNEYIISFLGVVYSPWCWYEKDDRTRWLVKSKGAEKQPDFFNIMLERHKDDPDGYDLMFIDPHRKGNYGSRLSHSCSPNCISVSMGVKGKYRIAVYASKDIKYGEELCFNYNSVTENEQEWLESICLCGTQDCNGQYLMYAGTQFYTEVMKKKHHLLHRAANLFNACCDIKSYNILSQQQKEILDKYSLKSCAMDGIPIWIQKYAALVCKYIDYEQDELPKELKSKADSGEKGYDEFHKQENAEEEVKGLKYIRLSNLVITLNKMNLFFRQPANKSLANIPMFKLFSPKEVIEKLWFGSNSIITDLSFYIAIYQGENHKIVQRINEIRSNHRQYLPFNQNGIKLSNQYLLELRDELLKLPPKPGAYHHAASDILLFYASTKYFFEHHPNYMGFQSRVFTFDELGYDKIGYPPPKKYAQQYVWGQLNFWERHTIESPDSSLSAERRGTICLPNISCCYIKPSTNKHARTIHRRQFNYHIRKGMIQHLQYKHWSNWSTRWHFGFKNGGIYGSPWLDSYIDPQNESLKFEKFIQTMKDTKMIYPDGTFMKIEEEPDIVDNMQLNQIECKTNSTNPDHILQTLSSSASANSCNEGESGMSDNNSVSTNDSNIASKTKRRSSRLLRKPNKNYAEEF